MARLLYGLGGDALVLTGAPGGGAAAYFDEGATGGLVARDPLGADPVTDLMSPDGSTPWTTVTATGNAQAMFLGPEGGTDPYLFVRFGGGPWFAVLALEVLDGLGDVAALRDEVDSHTAEIDALTEAVAAIPSGGTGGGAGFDPGADATVTGTWEFDEPLAVAAGTDPGHAARLADVDVAVGATGTSLATANALARRDAAGRVRVATPADAADAVNKAYADGLGSTTATAGIARRKTGGTLAVATPAVDEDAVPQGWAKTRVLGRPALDGLDSIDVPPGTPEGTIVLRLATPPPRHAWASGASEGETTSSVVPLSASVPASALGGQVCLALAVMGAAGTWTAPASAVTVQSSVQGAGMTLQLTGKTLTAADRGTTQQVTASVIPAGTRAKLALLAVEGVALAGAVKALSTVTTAATAQQAPGVAATGPGLIVHIVAARPTAIAPEGPHYTWAAGVTELFDDVVPATSSTPTLAVAVGVEVVTAAGAAVPRVATTDLAASGYMALSVWLPALPSESGSGSSGSGVSDVGTDAWLRKWGSRPDSMLRGARVLHPVSGEVVTSAVVWPDGAGTGTYTATMSATVPGAVDGWAVTYVPSAGGATKTVTQPPVTRSARTGAVTDRPDVVVS